MPTVYNVSAITNILSSTIQRNVLERNVLVRGEVEVLTDGPSNAFYLINGSNKLRCFIPPGVMAPMLVQGQIVVVDGKITLFSRFSQYQITVSDIQVNGVNLNAFSVKKITDEISRLVAETPELQNIRIQGKVLEVFGAAVSNWDLCDMDGSPALQIKCVRPGPINVPVIVGNNVCVRGEVRIYPLRSGYEINVSDVDSVTEAGTPTCRCSGCESCRPQGGNQSCPFLQDLEYELCANCYDESPDREDRVAQAVYRYFDALRVNGFSPDTEWQIQFGTRNGIADVVLTDSRGSLAAIAECKGAGYIGDGIEQLKSYLCATDTRFGIFANRKDPEQWEFYENRRRNRIDEIDRSEFEAGVANGITTRERLKDEIGHLNGEIARLENQISELDTTVNRITQIKHNLTESNSNLTQQIEVLESYKSELHEEIHRKLDHLLEKKIQRLERPLSDLKIELQKRGIKNWFKNLFSKENT